jgi:hypothetical protein
MTTKFHPLLKGAYELHVHSAPSLFPRKQTDWELIEDAKEAQMGGLVLKAHEAQTVDRATLIRGKEPELNVFGGLVCNHFTGGLSPITVDTSIRLGAKVIWMPTFSSEEHQRYFGKKNTRFFNSEKKLAHSYGLEIWDENKKILPEVHEILDLIAEADVVLATGHLAPAEVDVLVDAAIEHNVKKILIQHTDLGIARVPHQLEKELAKKGCILEKCYLATSNDFNDIKKEAMAESIKVLGADSCVMVTDYGQEHNIPPIEALSQFIEEMLRAGISEKEVATMIIDNPRQLLGV